MRKELDIIVNGPDIIRKPDCKWSITPEKKREVELTDELIIVRRLNITTLSEPLVKVENYSSWKKLLELRPMYSDLSIRCERRRQVILKIILTI